MKNWRQYRLGDFLGRRYDSVSIDNLTKYRRITIKTKGQGIDLRDEVDGIEIGTKNQFRVKCNQFLLSKIDAMNGAFGIVPENCNDGIITGNFWTYDLNEEIIERKYLELLCFKQEFTKFSIAASEGTTNRKYLREDKFLNLNISLPSISEQQEIVTKFETVKTTLERVKQLRDEQSKDIGNLLFSKYTDLIETAEWLPMKEVAPIHRRQLEIIPDKTYQRIGVRSFGRGLFENPSFKGSELTWQKIFRMNVGDLLFSNANGWEGAVGLIPKKYDGWVGSHRYITCLPNLEIINPEFLFYYFTTTEGVGKLSQASPGTVARTRTLNNKLLMDIVVPVPSLELQQEFVELLNKTNAIKEHRKQPELELSDIIPSLLDKLLNNRNN
jgi:type I restriction enzyme S subunit